MERYGLPLAYLLTQAGWAGAVGEVLGARLTPGAPLASPILALLTLGAAYGAAQALRRIPAAMLPFASLALGAAWTVGSVWLSRHAGQDGAWLAAISAALSGTRPTATADALALALVFFLWWRGQRTFAAPPLHDSTVRSFGLGALALGGALLIGGGLHELIPTLTWCILLFLCGGLTALSLARLQEVRHDLVAGAVRGEPARLGAAWRRTLLPPVAAVVAAGLIASVALGEPATRAAILTALGRLGELVLAVLYWPVLLVGFAVEWLVYALRTLRRPRGEQAAEAPSQPDADELLSRLQGSSGAAPAWLAALPWLAGAAVAVVALYAYWVTARRREPEDEPTGVPAAQREALGTWDLFLDDLRLLVRRLLGRLRPRRALEALSALPRLGASGRRGAVEEAADPRAAYRQLLALGRGRAVARRREQTPDEYLATWQQALPAAEEAAALTGAYRAARYGPEGDPEGAPPPSVLRALLARIRVVFEATGD
ncbi:MAG TPA: DUF4129 domain-containing protein [Chloroflexota bacterium]|nr:DUF4129 domain-containing protein [Chloroflexota bacterium]